MTAQEALIENLRRIDTDYLAGMVRRADKRRDRASQILADEAFRQLEARIGNDRALAAIR